MNRGGQSGPAAGSLVVGSLPDIVDDAITRYIAARHARVGDFVDATYSLRGALRLHRKALGADLVRVPANVAMMVPQLGLQAAAAGLRRVGARRWGESLSRRRLFLETDVARELTWKIQTELLELPYRDGDRESVKDSLSDELMADPRLRSLQEALRTIAERSQEDGPTRERLRQFAATYTDSRTAAAEIFTNACLAGAGAFAFQKLTPGALSLGPVLATAVAQQAAIASFPLGSALGGLVYSQLAVTPSAFLVAASTGGLAVVAALTATFAGIVTDPLQRALGVHQRRLHRFVDGVGMALQGDENDRFHVRDQYLARLFDLVDLVRVALPRHV